MEVPRSLQLGTLELPSFGRGAYVSIDEAPPLSDVMEIVFLPDAGGLLPHDVFVARS